MIGNKVPKISNLFITSCFYKELSGSEVVRIFVFNTKAHDIISDIIDISFDSSEGLYFAITLPDFAD